MESHIVSAFVYRWFKRTMVVPNRPMVSVDAITREYDDRVQDGLKTYFLCSECEQDLSVDEREFNERLFAPYHAGKIQSVAYDRWLARFAVANTWRVLQFHLQGPVDGWPPMLHQRALRAAEHWRRFLRREVRGLTAFPVHMIALSDDFSPDLYTNKILEATVAVDSKWGDEFLYVKMGGLLIVGVIHDVDARRQERECLHDRVSGHKPG